MALLPILIVAAGWQDTLKKDLTLLGHRNWICVVDSAYPAQTSPGIKMIDTREDHVTVLKAVVGVLKSARHVRPQIYLDHELSFVAEKDAPGIAKLRQSIFQTLGVGASQMPRTRSASPLGAPVARLPHEKIIAKLEDAGKSFQVLLLKTNCNKPYTSIFMELNCGYWSDAAEKRLRDAIGKAGGETPSIIIRPNSGG